MWDYMTWIVEKDFGGGEKVRAINGTEIKNRKQRPSLADALAHAGRRGWELAGIHTPRRAYDDDPRYIFKRRRQANAI